ncbi:Beta-barrel assembly-enhancing protease [Enhygromyxa salina]|uniref:Beta-barrel assembly-enhancing protease n=1 Tax=Enhygromyxa salina TaxID=215803 RepID=A0A2S9XE67_9BACT|nr:tetratricopeptide repeat protein [Enhygromyxa salina]PRP91147.1 Beta-barrel assembly-enhancing protease [Enhygromyxa salina]
MKIKLKQIHRLQRAAGVVLGVLVVLLIADSAFLATAATPEGLVAPMLRLHLVLGASLCAVVAVFVAGHFVIHRRHRNARARKIGLVVAALAGLGCVAGLALWRDGGQARPLVLAHELAFVTAIAAYVLHRVRALATPALKVEWIGAGVALVMLGGIWAAQLWWPTSASEAPSPRAPFVPGLAQTRTVDGHLLGTEDLANPEYCAQCHTEIAARWESSAHRVSSLNDPFYAATLAVSQGHKTPDQIKFCGGCHDPLLLLTGRMDTHPKPEDPDADAGITCLACHAIVEAPGRLGNGSYVIAAPEHYPGYASDDPSERETSNRLIQSKPAKHIASFAPPHLRSSQICAGCHKAHIPPELNDHRWVPGQNDWDAWHDSGAGANSARTFYPPKAKRCQDCHMPRIPGDDPAARDGTVTDHGFPGANTALPFVQGDEQWQARNEAFLDGVVSVDVGAIEVGVPGAEPLRVMAPGASLALPPGAPVTLDLSVRNRRSGHLFPGGISDLREAWLELTLTDEHGEVLAASGWLDPRGKLDPDAHRWNTTLLDAKGEPLTVHEVEDTYVVLTSRRIMLGASDVVRVSFTAPNRAARLSVRVLHRKFPRDYVEFVLGEDAPRMPITPLATTQIAFEPGPTIAAAPGPDAGDRLRALGIAYLLRGDTTLARVAASAAAERLPADPGPQLDLARAALADGALADAEAHVRAADGLAPGHPTAAWLLARIRAASGDHAAALAALEVALAVFPNDRELLVMKGESLFRLERDAEAAAALTAVLAIDPEHLGAHALLTRIYTDSGDQDAAERHQRAWDRHRPRSEDSVVTERARREDPALDRRANLQYVLPLAPVPEGWTRATRPSLEP